MNNALYVTLSRQTALFRNMSVIANNIANANTSGYKSEKMIFTDYIKKDAGGEDLAFAQDISTTKNMSQGEISSTGSAFDVAIDGEGFFMVDTPDGQKYTRTGNFALNAAGDLVTASGFRVTNNNGTPITVPENATDLTIRKDGMVQVFVDGIEEQLGVIGVMKFEDLQRLKSEGGGLYSGEGGVPAGIEEFQILQGSIEGSNVNSVQEMTNMIEVSRSVGSAAKFAKELHQLMLKAVDTIAKQG
jgi:flagellar basal-body rod protein FlgF